MHRQEETVLAVTEHHSYLRDDGISLTRQARPLTRTQDKLGFQCT